MRYVYSVSYSVNLNGSSNEWFSPSRGLSQGDPLSPYLFFVCTGFSTLIEEAKQKGLMRGVPIERERFSINHLFFADDCILFGDASVEGAKVVGDVIKEYETISGQRVNFEKSLIYFKANVNVNINDSITTTLGVRVASKPKKYLGLPMMKYEGSGEYSVKSGYRVLATDYLQNINYINSTADIYKIFYKSLWSINISEKIKIHIWRLLNNYLPHYSNILLRKLRNDSVCPLCKEASEDIDHLLWSCSLLQGRSPVLSFIKINFDATFQRDSRTSTIAVLARDSRGEIRGAETYLIEDVADAFIVEARACERSLLFTRMMGFWCLVVEGDSLTVIKKLQARVEDKSILRPIIHHIRDLEHYFEKVVYLFVPHSVNDVAHTLAAEGRRSQRSEFGVDGVSASVTWSVERDWRSWMQTNQRLS
ncbi:hypothetical protein PVK06_043917 [Gossypium arboreum]|uniref:Reverse transcriptase n=1 Tax=Gossypium arboreum TaxID=29729 RepID=A0ABR0MQ33_GOSAR|nr:hypothetical protein PVK06_043917 [Gossypium arboreum]